MAPLIRRIHFYAGMFIGPFIFIAALTGAAYAVAPTLENVVYGDILSVEPTDHPVPLEQQVNSAAATHPDLDIAQVWPGNDATDATRVLLVDDSLDEGLLRSVFVDPGTGAVIGDEPSYSGLGELPLRHFISQAHKNLWIGEPGRMYAELAAEWMWFVALGGLYLWIKRAGGGRILRGIARRHQPENGEATAAPRQRRALLNLHGVAGTWLLIAMLGLSATGITWSLFAGQNVKDTVSALSWEPRKIETSISDAAAANPAGGGSGEHAGHEGHEGHEGHADHTENGGAKNPGTPADQAKDSAVSSAAQTQAAQAETVLRTAREEGLTGSLRMYPPKDEHSAWQASERWVPWRTTSDAVSVNGATGAVVDRLPFAELPLFSKLTSWGIYLHMGIMFGLPLQLALCVVALGIATLVVVGYLLWWKRRPTRNAVAGIPGPVTGLSAAGWAIALVFLALVGTFLPLFGLTLATMLAVDALLVRRARKLTAQPAPVAD